MRLDTAELMRRMQSGGQPELLEGMAASVGYIYITGSCDIKNTATIKFHSPFAAAEVYDASDEDGQKLVTVLINVLKEMGLMHFRFDCADRPSVFLCLGSEDEAKQNLMKLTVRMYQTSSILRDNTNPAYIQVINSEIVDMMGLPESFKLREVSPEALFGIFRFVKEARAYIKEKVNGPKKGM